ncbi:unnamed protein product [Cylindrotheca closterium]|uniref:DUF6824 domain-containing protein n=1 Tax=Cylindrotheca closterium TaxID=2856 RepID=A0AAD2FYG7_9STRA|nr:unnamed protein product [Cylindrotheca closterium]
MAMAMTENRSIFSCFGCGEEPKHHVVTTSARPSSHETTPEIEEFLASQMSKLSVEERDEATHDIHCVGEDILETPEMVETSLAEFDNAIKREKNETYEIAMAQNRAYVEDASFRLKFVRANMHDVNRSVNMMLRFLEQKALHFGIEKVARDITIDDLTDEDKKFMQLGLFHIQEGRDRSGRIVFYYFNRYVGSLNPATVNRIFYYVVFNILINMPTAQLKGVNGIYYDVVKLKKDAAVPGFNYVKTFVDFWTCIPIRFSSTHYCLKRKNLARSDFILKTALQAAHKYVQARTRVHVGSDIELQYQLQGHGIPIQFCPVDGDGKYRTEILNRWLNKHESVPASNQGKDVKKSKQSFVPLRHDVLLGRGKSLQTHLGNICFREFVKQYSEEYDETPRNYRRLVPIKVIQDLKSRGIRFLRQDESTGEWVEPEISDIEKTVGQVFRNLRKKHKPESL